MNRLTLLKILTAIWLCACEAAPPPTPAPATQQRPVSRREGYSIPVFATPADHLRYARGWFADPKEKAVILRELIDRYPADASIRGQAELTLAYMELGGDYRLADHYACQRAIAAYERVIAKFADQPTICAQAIWYAGWILCDLLHQPEKGRRMYMRIVAEYPDSTLNMEPPVPWVSLVLPDAGRNAETRYERPHFLWSSLALLELIRGSSDPKEKKTLFESLWQKDPASLAAGYALLDIIKQPSITKEVLAHAGAYLSAGNPTRSLAGDISRALQNRLTAPSPLEGRK